MGGEKKQLHLLYRLQKLGNCVIADAPLPSLEIHFNSKPDPSEYLEEPTSRDRLSSTAPQTLTM